MEKIINNKNKILASVTAFFVLLMLLVLSACTTTGKEFEIFQNTLYSHLVVKSANETSEEFRINYSGVIWSSEQQKQNFVDETKVFFNEFSEMLNTHYKTLLIEKNFEEGTIPSAFATFVNQNDNIILVVKFPSAEIWKQVSLKNGLIASTQTKTDFFTYSIIDTVEKVGSVITVGGVDEFVGDYFFKELNNFLSQKNYDNVLNASEIKNVFGYVTPSKKLHSNSDSLGSLSGKYFHFWNLTDVSNVRLEFSSTYPRVEIWYIMAIGLGLLVLSVVFFISYFKKESFDEPKFNETLHKKALTKTQTSENEVLNQNDNLLENKVKNVNKNVVEDNTKKASLPRKIKTTKVDVVAKNKTASQIDAKIEKNEKPEKTVKEKPEKQEENLEAKPRRKTTKKDN